MSNDLKCVWVGVFSWHCQHLHICQLSSHSWSTRIIFHKYANIYSFPSLKFFLGKTQFVQVHIQINFMFLVQMTKNMLRCENKILKIILFDLMLLTLACEKFLFVYTSNEFHLPICLQKCLDGMNWICHFNTVNMTK